MGWRTVLVSNNCKLSYKNDYLIIRNEKLNMIHLSEINMIIIENGMASITSYLINELANKKIKLIICDEKHNPSCEMIPYYGSFNTSKKIHSQISWKKEEKDKAWQNIVKYKIHNQAMLLKKLHIVGYEKLLEYEQQVEIGDKTNREGHAAKVYFNALFGMDFSRSQDNNINAALNYGYSIILSAFNREITSNGYLTQLGLYHNNMFNQFNLGSDLMEPFRILVDRMVCSMQLDEFELHEKMKLVDLLNQEIFMEGKHYIIMNAIKRYVKSVFDALNDSDIALLTFYSVYEL